MQDTLDRSKLQVAEGGGSIEDIRELDTYEGGEALSETADDCLQFKAEGSKMRSELRELEYSEDGVSGGGENSFWPVSGESHTMTATVGVPEPDKSEYSELTFLQVHCDGSFVRVYWRAEMTDFATGSKHKNCIGVAVKNAGGDHDHYYLLDYTSEKLAYSVTIKDQKLNLIAGSSKLMDIEVENNSECYFKAGLYVTDIVGDSCSSPAVIDICDLQW